LAVYPVPVVIVVAAASLYRADPWQMPAALAGVATASMVAGWLARTRHARLAVPTYVASNVLLMDVLFWAVDLHYGLNPVYVGVVFVIAAVFVFETPAISWIYAVNHVIAMAPFFRQPGWGGPVFGQSAWVATAWIVSRLMFSMQLEGVIANRTIARQNAELAWANAQLASVNAEKDELMAIAAHDLKSPLSAMLYLFEELRRTPAIADTARVMERTCRDMFDLVTRLLEVHHAEAGPLALQAERVDVGSIVRTTADAYRAAAEAKRVRIRVEAPAGDRFARGDPDACGRAIGNLLSNAIKFTTPDSEVGVTVSTIGARVAVAVTDAGPGISSEDQARLFRKFGRLRSRPTAGESSTGLGLFIVRQLAHAMGGDVR
jgi:signal transduction histidine kinase